MAMRRIRPESYGGPGEPEVETVADLPAPGAGDVRVRVPATSAAFTDVMIRKRMYPDVKEWPPFTPGYHMVGVVDAAGPGAVPAGRPRRRPDHHRRLFRVHLSARGPADPGAADRAGCRGAWCHPLGRDGLPAAAPGGDACAGAEPAHPRRRGRCRQGRAPASAGCGDHGLRHRSAARHDPIRSLGATRIAAEADEAALRAATVGGVGAVFDPLGGDRLSRSLHALNSGGLLVAYGFRNAVLGHGGSILLDFAKLKLWDWLPNGHATAFYSIGAMRRRHPDWFRAELERLIAMLAAGQIAPVIAEVLTLEEVREAHRRPGAGTVAGKLALRVFDP